jgi:hypothetical protein
VLGPKRHEVIGEWRKLRSEGLHNLYSSPDIIMQIRSGEVGGTCGTRERRGKCTWFWWESQKEIDHLKDQGVNGRMGSEWILWRLDGGV